MQLNLVSLLPHLRLPDPLVGRLLIPIGDDEEQGRKVCVRDLIQGRDRDLLVEMEQSQRQLLS